MRIATKIHLIVLGLTLSLVATIVSAQTTTVIKFSHVAPSDTPKGQAALRFKELTEQASRRRVRVDVYPNNQLYKESDELEALQLGAVQMVAPSLAKLAQFGVQDFEIFDLPYLFANKDAVSRVTEGAIGKSMLRKLESKGMIGLAYWNNGFKIMSSNKPLKMPADFIGQRMRIHSSPVLEDQMEALGAIPQMLDGNEIYFALHSRIVDGVESSPVNFYAKKLYEVQSHVTVSNHGYLGNAVIVNKKFWDSLPSDLRKVIEDAMREATVYGNNLAAKENDAALEAIKKNKKVTVHFLTEKENAAWRQALQPVRKQLEGRVGKAIVMAATKEVEARHLSER
ncbi:DctP family TRAP transporter solute-binding subunit [Herminiimonas aquatilis]|uniref:DctP family TRAP transporter solute-binding subunit n=1 Tax=Herminiimonas aquatilis TaxID=345342 RepID=A0ABW2J3K1_9BURK